MTDFKMTSAEFDYWIKQWEKEDTKKAHEHVESFLSGSMWIRVINKLFVSKTERKLYRNLFVSGAIHGRLALLRGDFINDKTKGP